MSKKEIITAIITDKKGRVLSIGKNSYVKTHPLQALHAKRVGQENRIYLHAEIDAIIRCKSLSKAHKIFVSRLKHNRYMLAKPCVVCMSAISQAGIKHIEWTDYTTDPLDNALVVNRSDTHLNE